jgi:hypothetical protein
MECKRCGFVEYSTPPKANAHICSECGYDFSSGLCWICSRFKTDEGILWCEAVEIVPDFRKECNLFKSIEHKFGKKYKKK